MARLKTILKIKIGLKSNATLLEIKNLEFVLINKLSHIQNSSKREKFHSIFLIRYPYIIMASLSVCLFPCKKDSYIISSPTLEKKFSISSFDRSLFVHVTCAHLEFSPSKKVFLGKTKKVINKTILREPTSR